jgi:hypothetical protein
MALALFMLSRNNFGMTKRGDPRHRMKIRHPELVLALPAFGSRITNRRRRQLSRNDLTAISASSAAAFRPFSGAACSCPLTGGP